MAFVSKLAIEREVKAGRLHAMKVEGISLTRSLRCVADPARYQSRAVRAFINILFDPSAYLPEQAPTPLEAEVSFLPRKYARRILHPVIAVVQGLQHASCRIHQSKARYGYHVQPALQNVSASRFGMHARPPVEPVLFCLGLTDHFLSLSHERTNV